MQGPCSSSAPLKRARTNSDDATSLPRPSPSPPSNEGNPGATKARGGEQSCLASQGLQSLLVGCRSVDRYKKLNRIDEGTYGVVYRACDIATGEVVALKQLKVNAAKSDDGFPVPSLREVTLLSKLDHPNIVRLHEVCVGKSPQHIVMVMEYAAHELRALLERHQFGVAEVKCLMKQLLGGVAHLHERWVIHRDLKTSNILLTSKGVLKVCDFGLARHYGEPYRIYTHNVITLWYRAPELVMGLKRYTISVDVWSTGCVFAEMFLRKPLFEGKSELHQLTLIYELTGVPTEETWPGYKLLPCHKKFKFKPLFPKWHVVFPPEGPLSAQGVELLKALLTCCPDRRVTAEAALEDPYFWERPVPVEPDMMASFQETNSTGREFRPTVAVCRPRPARGGVAALL